MEPVDLVATTARQVLHRTVHLVVVLDEVGQARIGRQVGHALVDDPGDGLGLGAERLRAPEVEQHPVDAGGLHDAEDLARDHETLVQETSPV